MDPGPPKGNGTHREDRDEREGELVLISAEDADRLGRGGRVVFLREEPHGHRSDSRRSTSAEWGDDEEGKDETIDDETGPRMKRRGSTRIYRAFSTIPGTLPVVMETLPYVSEVESRQRGRACALWCMLTALFAVLAAVTVYNKIMIRNRPPQTVRYEEVPAANRFPNQVICYPTFAGNATWLAPRSYTYTWKTKEGITEDSFPYDLLDESNCTMIKSFQKGSCMFIHLNDELELPEDKSRWDGGVELHIALMATLSPSYQYRGVYMSMTNLSVRRWCNETPKEEGIRWEEAPLEDYSKKAAFLTYIDMEVATALRKKLKRAYHPDFRDFDYQTPYLEYTTRSKLGGYRRHNDSQTLAPDVVTTLEALEGDKDNFGHIMRPFVGRFYIHFGSSTTTTIFDVEPLQLFELLGMLSGAWSAIFVIFSLCFVAERTKRTVPTYVRAIGKRLDALNEEVKKQLTCTKDVESVRTERSPRRPPGGRYWQESSP